MVEVTIEITQWCDHNCSYCSSNATDKGEHLSFDKIKEFLDGVKKDLKCDRINISGGEPLAHPEFFKIKRYCDSLVGKYNVWVYTNEIVNIVHNADVVPHVAVHANVVVRPGTIFIPTEAHKVHLLKLIHQGRGKNLKPFEVSASHNFTSSHCSNCNHILLQSDGKIREAPCRKDYE